MVFAAAEPKPRRSSRVLISLLVLTAATFLMGWIGKLALSREWFARIDAWGEGVTLSEQSLQALELLAQVASVRGVVVVSLVMIAILAIRKDLLGSATLFGSAVTAAIAQSIVKDWVGRPRPATLAIVQSDSFPSGQTFLAVAVYGLFALLLMRSQRSWAARTATGIVALVLITLIAYGRIALEAHFLSDVLASIALGFIWLIMGMWVAAKPSLSRRRGPSRWSRHFR